MTPREYVVVFSGRDSLIDGYGYRQRENTLLREAPGTGLPNSKEQRRGMVSARKLEARRRMRALHRRRRELGLCVRCLEPSVLYTCKTCKPRR